MSIQSAPPQIDTIGLQRLSLSFTLNGREVEAEVEPRTMLLDLIRDEFGLKGAKRSCDVQVCGACTVLVDGEPVSSCCTLAYEVDGKSLTTIEGIGRNGVLDPVQQAFVEAGAIQCGFCTPGLVLTTKALLTECPDPSRSDIEQFLGGNLCRCTGYWRILDAVELAARTSSSGREVDE